MHVPRWRHPTPERFSLHPGYWSAAAAAINDGDDAVVMLLRNPEHVSRLIPCRVHWTELERAVSIMTAGHIRPTSFWVERMISSGILGRLAVCF